MNNITNTLNQLAGLSDAVEAHIATLKNFAADYADEAHHAKKTGNPLASFGGSEAQKTLDAISIKLKAASQQVQFVGTELVRFS